MNTIKRNTEFPSVSEVTLEVNVEETMSRHRNEEQRRYIKVANKSFEKLADFKYLSTAVTH
jgi:hypothetical protein